MKHHVLVCLGGLMDEGEVGLAPLLANKDFRGRWQALWPQLYSILAVSPRSFAYMDSLLLGIWGCDVLHTAPGFTVSRYLREWKTHHE